jgi:hypothetical protein
MPPAVARAARVTQQTTRTLRIPLTHVVPVHAQFWWSSD